MDKRLGFIFELIITACIILVLRSEALFFPLSIRFILGVIVFIVFSIRTVEKFGKKSSKPSLIDKIPIKTIMWALLISAIVIFILASISMNYYFSHY